MSNYKFMRSGLSESTGSGTGTGPDLEHILVLLTIFSEDAMKLCDVYVTHENRSIVTKNDTVKALQVRAYYGTEFWARPDIQEKIEETTIFLKDLSDKIEGEEINDKKQEQEQNIKLESEIESDSDSSYEDLVLEEAMIYSTNYGYTCSCEICHRMNNIHLYWSSWKPTDQSDKILKDAINKSATI